ncbi:MAG: dihydroorotase [Acidobacteria bacterium]|nr:MAG: dihydroorotase [Acidobacteriota bacterium]
MSTILLKGGHLIDPARAFDAPADLVLRDGHVLEIAAPGAAQTTADETLDVKGLVVAPGFIDIHVHLREPGQTHKETIATGTAAAAAGGFTSVCAMPNTRPINDSPALTRWMQDKERGAVVNVFPIAAATLGSQGEKLSNYRELKKAGAVALSDDGNAIMDDNVMREALAHAARIGLTLIQHAEDKNISGGNPINEGVMSFKLGLRGQPAASEWLVVERDIRLASQEGAHLHIAHVSTAKSLELVRLGRAKHVNVTTEVTPHHFLFTEESCSTYDTRYKMNPPLRSEADRKALVAALIDGTIDAIATDHAPHALFEKEVEFDKAAFGITGLEIAVAAAVTTLHHTGKVPLKRIVELFSTNPAKIVGLNGRGTLAEGSVADITIFDPKERWTYDVTKTRSRSRNCPYDGMQFFGKARATIVGGNIVFNEL